MARSLRLLGLALLCGAAGALAQTRLDLAANPAWGGWTRPGRATEIDVRLSAGAATRATLEIAAGAETVRADTDLEPGRTVRLHVPIGSAETVAVSAASASTTERREVALAQSESPLLGAALAAERDFRLEGFHTVAIGADDFPRNAAAYASIDALVVDAPTLAALDERQLGALLAHAGDCGRIVLLNPDPRAFALLAGATACGERTLLRARTLDEAREALESSLRADAAPPGPAAGVADPAGTGRATWNRVLAAVAAYVAAAVVAFAIRPSVTTVVLLSSLATAAILALLPLIEPAPRLVVWAEGESGAQAARYRARQWLAESVRGRMRAPMLPQLASARPCSPGRPIRLEFDPAQSRLTHAEFEARLFRQDSVCYSGSFPVARTIAIETGREGSLEVRNAGTRAWPKGTLLYDGLAYDLPALEPGASVTMATRAGVPLRDAVARAAWARSHGGWAALWALDLGRVAGMPGESTGWLVISVPPPST